MKYGVFFAAATATPALGLRHKGDLTLPKEGDKARFGVIQTGLKSILQRTYQSEPTIKPHQHDPALRTSPLFPPCRRIPARRLIVLANPR